MLFVVSLVTLEVLLVLALLVHSTYRLAVPTLACGIELRWLTRFRQWPLRAARLLLMMLEVKGPERRTIVPLSVLLLPRYMSPLVLLLFLSLLLLLPLPLHLLLLPLCLPQSQMFSLVVVVSWLQLLLFMLLFSPQLLVRLLSRH